MTQIEKAQYYFKKAYKANERNDFKTARKDYEKAIELNPKFTKAYVNLALILSPHFKEHEKAKQYYEKAIEINPNLFIAYNGLGLILHEQLHEYEKAKQNYEKAIRLNPNNSNAYYNYANLLLQYFQEYEQAKQYYEKTIELEPNHKKAHNNLANLLKTHFQEYKKAEEYYEKAIKLNPKDAFNYNNFANLFADYLQEYEKAKQYFEKAIELNPNYEYAYFNFANLLTNHFEEYEKAKQYYEKAIELNPSYTEAYNNFAILLTNNFQESEKAKQYFEKAIELNSNFSEAYNNLANLYYYKFNDLENAQKNFMLAIEKEPSYEYARQALGEISNFEKETFISEFEIKNVRHLKNIKIKLAENKRKHLFLTGKNGSGKTSVLKEIENYFQPILEISTTDIFTEKGKNEFWKEKGDYNLKFNIKQHLLDLRLKYETNDFLIVFFEDTRFFTPDVPEHIEKVILKQKYLPKENASKDFIKYLVYQDYKRLAIKGDKKNEIDIFFKKTKEILQLVYNEPNLDFYSGISKDELDFYIKLPNDNIFNFNGLASGYSAILRIIFELVLRTQNTPNKTNSEGIVLIDEPETHLHVEMQKKIMPMLIKMFPHIQFIVATHSPFILNSVANTVVYDLEKRVRAKDFSAYAYDSIVEKYFDNDKYSEIVKLKLNKFKKLLFNKNINDNEKSELRKLEYYFENIPTFAAPELIAEFQRLQIKKINQND